MQSMFIKSKNLKITFPNIFKSVVFFKWPYSVPVLCYFTFCIIIWILAVPLKSIQSQNLEQHQKDKHKYQLLNDEETFVIRMKNSNFNTDKAEENKNEPLNEIRDEYLVNLNNQNDYERKKTEREILQTVFKNADKDHNNRLDSRELSGWIRKKIMEHISLAVGNNYALFTKIDVNPKNGVITWEEYHSYFLKRRGFDQKYVESHDERRHRGLQKSLKEQIMRDKAYWMEAARSNVDSLTVDEFLSFTHPESSASNQLAMVDELYDRFDRDGDEYLTEDEFAVMQTEGDDDEIIVIRQDENQRREEFQKSIDVNGDGKADRRELLHYVAPQSPRHSEHEAKALLSLADVDLDKMLSLNEILAHPDLFLKSKMVDTARSFHDEF